MRDLSTGFVRADDYEEKLRRLQCLADATDSVTEAELYFREYSAMGLAEHEMNDAASPFAGWSHDGEINVIYDRTGRVDHVTVIDDDRKEFVTSLADMVCGKVA